MKINDCSGTSVCHAMNFHVKYSWKNGFKWLLIFFCMSKNPEIIIHEVLCDQTLDIAAAKNSIRYLKLGSLQLFIKVLFALNFILLFACISDATFCQPPELPSDSLISGEPPVPRNKGCLSWTLEAIITRLSFANKCGSASTRPTCNCSDGAQWKHPYFVADCANGADQTSCSCPDGTPYPWGWRHNYYYFILNLTSSITCQNCWLQGTSPDSVFSLNQNLMAKFLLANWPTK